MPNPRVFYSFIRININAGEIKLSVSPEIGLILSSKDDHFLFLLSDGLD